MLWAAHGPITSRGTATRRHVLSTRRRTVGPTSNAIDATHRVAANGFKVRVNIRTPGPPGPRTPIVRPRRGKRRRRVDEGEARPQNPDGVVLFFFYDKT